MARDDARFRSMREQARDGILSAALEVFGERGFTDATTAEVAEQAKVSKGLIFNYFPTKAALLQALIEKTLGEILDFWEAQPSRPGAREQLAQLVDNAVSQVCERPNFYRLYFALTLQPGGSAPVEQALSALKPRLDIYFERSARLMGELGSPDPALDAKLLQCAVNGLAQVIAVSAGFTGETDLVPTEALKKRLLERFSPAQDRSRRS